MLSLHLSSPAWFRTSRGIHLTFSGPVLCSLQYPVITVDEFADYSLELWVERVRDAVSSTEQHTNTALLNSTPRRLSGCLDPVLCPRVRSSPQPDADILPLDRLHNGRGRGDQVKQESKSLLSTIWWTTASFGFNNSDSNNFKMQVSFSREEV